MIKSHEIRVNPDVLKTFHRIKNMRTIIGTALFVNGNIRKRRKDGLKGLLSR